MPTHLSSQVPLNNTVGGGNLGLFVQYLQNADGTFSPMTVGTDALGDPFGTVHELGSQIDSAFNRSNLGQYSCPVTVIENDVDHLNMLENLAPYNPTAVDNNPEDSLEDGTIIGGANSVYGDPSLPFWLFCLFGKPLGGKERCRVFIGQFQRQGGFDQKAKQRNKFKFTVMSVDAKGLAVTTLPTHARTATMTAPTLSANFAHGEWVSST